MTYTRTSIGVGGRVVVRGWHTAPKTDQPAPVRLPTPPDGFCRHSMTLTSKDGESFVRCRWTDRHIWRSAEQGK